MPAHRCAFRVYYEDTDAGGVMYHAQYLAFAERGRSEALREAGVPATALLERHGIAFVVRRLQAEYLRPLRLDALVTVETALRERRAASLRLRQSPPFSTSRWRRFAWPTCGRCACRNRGPACWTASPADPQLRPRPCGRVKNRSPATGYGTKLLLRLKTL